MSACETLTNSATAGAAAALRAVDCLANEATASAFGRLFGAGGDSALLPVLTLLLTLYVAFFAISLLTGRSRLGISALTPRMMTLGLVLTFATSWAAYQGVVWNLAVGGPDQIAVVLMGAQGSATQLFADRIDMVFAAIASAAANATPGASAQGAAAQVAAGSFSPTNLMWLAALLLMLGTVGVLVTARIALAVLLALGPVFVVMVLFPGTRGLFAGWLRGVVMTALAPLFAVLGGGFMLELAVPVIADLSGAEGIDGRASMALFLIAAVHVALMAMVLRVVGTMVSGWTVFGLAGERGREGSGSRAEPAPAAAPLAASVLDPQIGSLQAARRPVPLALPAPASVEAASDPGPPRAAHARSGRMLVTQVSEGSAGLALLPQRARGIGSRFRPAGNVPREMIR